MLYCSFGNFSSPKITIALRSYSKYNPKDDKGTTDQNLLTFGSVMQERLNLMEEPIASK
jgi:hypothetical protein